MDEVWARTNAVLANFYFDDELNYLMDRFKVFLKSWYFDAHDLNINLKRNASFLLVTASSEFWRARWARGFLDLRASGFIFTGWKAVIEVIQTYRCTLLSQNRVKILVFSRLTFFLNARGRHFSERMHPEYPAICKMKNTWNSKIWLIVSIVSINKKKMISTYNFFYSLKRRRFKQNQGKWNHQKLYWGKQKVFFTCGLTASLAGLN